MDSKDNLKVEVTRDEKGIRKLNNGDYEMYLHNVEVRNTEAMKALVGGQVMKFNAVLEKYDKDWAKEIEEKKQDLKRKFRNDKKFVTDFENQSIKSLEKQLENYKEAMLEALKAAEMYIKAYGDKRQKKVLLAAFEGEIDSAKSTLQDELKEEIRELAEFEKEGLLPQDAIEKLNRARELTD